MQIKEKLESLGLAPDQLSSVTALLSDIVAEHDRTVKDLKLDHGLQMAFKDNRAKDGKLIKALLDMDVLSLDEENGSINGLDDKPTFKGFQPGTSKDIRIGAGSGGLAEYVGRAKEWDNSDIIL